MTMHAQAINFDEAIDRRGSNSLKWDSVKAFLPAEAAAADPLPMWVADMDFRAPQPVIDALVKAAQAAVFGYSFGASDSYVAAVTAWQYRRFGWDVWPEWVVPVSGVITALKTIVQAFSAPGDTVLIQPPVYAHFHDDVLVNGRFPVSAPLIRTEDGYRYDATVFEAAIQPNTRIFILSNPHNPTGKVWTKDELRSMGEICARRGVLVVSDEIHQDLIMNLACMHVPFASLATTFAENSITCTAPSKTFNLPGLQCANAFIPNERLRAQFQRQLERNLYPKVNAFGMVAAEAAYSQGEAWLDHLIVYVRANHARFATEINKLNAGLKVLPADALYLAWMDCRALGMDAAALETFMLTRARLWLDKGQKFGLEGHGYMRVNLGCPRATVDEAITRLKAALAAR
ncbi:MalY/PatB family protein [Mesorhizobium atlanticum]|uniref:cysteine-S-conjugate beta-lyase n=1 Tax=Mesorhizobium atlanticum TaxID=2233532 RepID=A0A330GKB5_9HYPH|nr:MalY/PatB family protein [Mesorhizobium atlanticum]RAZ72967.1 aspartate aminotransferase [Mesorhizobium atlanticum]